jgi:hypothetical protein
MSKVCVAGFGLSLDGFSAGIEQSLSDPLGSRGRTVVPGSVGPETTTPRPAGSEDLANSMHNGVNGRPRLFTSTRGSQHRDHNPSAEKDFPTVRTLRPSAVVPMAEKLHQQGHQHWETRRTGSVQLGLCLGNPVQ